MKNLNICIAGLGNVGSAVVGLIDKNSQYIKIKSNLTINIIGLSAKNRDKERNFNVRDYKWIENPIDLLNINDLKPGQGFILQVSQPGTISWNPVMLEEEDAG